MNKRMTLLTIVSSLVVVIVGITIAYAALQANLSITTQTITQNAQTWLVKFTGSATPTPGGTSATGRSCGTATVGDTTVTVAATTLSKPEDSCIYKLTVSNAGTIDAKLNSITPTSPSGATCTGSGATLVCGNITYKLATASGTIQETTELPINTTLAHGNTQDVYLIVEYTGSGVVSSTVTQSGAAFTLVYGQN